MILMCGGFISNPTTSLPFLKNTGANLHRCTSSVYLLHMRVVCLSYLLPVVPLFRIVAPIDETVDEERIPCYEKLVTCNDAWTRRHQETIIYKLVPMMRGSCLLNI